MNIWSWVCSQLARVVVRVQKKNRIGAETGEREEVKKQGQYTQRNVVLQTIELAKLKCTVTMGTLGEKKRENKINNEIQKKAETICTFKYDYICGLSSSYSPKTVNVSRVAYKI